MKIFLSKYKDAIIATSIILAWMLVFTVLVLINGITITSSSIDPVEVTTEQEFPTGKREITFTSVNGEKVLAKIRSNTFYDGGDSVIVKPEKETTKSIEFYRVKDYIFFKMISQDAFEYNVELDYTPPQLDLKHEIAPQQSFGKVFFSFKDNEKGEYTMHAVIDNSEELEDVDMHTQCSKNNLSYAMDCSISLPSEEPHNVTLFAQDALGNKTYFLDNQEITHIEPLAFECPDVPKETNEREVSFSCSADRAFSYYYDKTKGSAEAGESVDLTFELEKYANEITVQLRDNEYRPYEKTFEINRQPIIYSVNDVLSCNTSVEDFVAVDGVLALPDSFFIYGDYANLDLYPDGDRTNSIDVRLKTGNNKNELQTPEYFYTRSSLVLRDRHGHVVPWDSKLRFIGSLGGFGDDCNKRLTVTSIHQF